MWTSQTQRHMCHVGERPITIPLWPFCAGHGGVVDCRARKKRWYICFYRGCPVGGTPEEDSTQEEEENHQQQEKLESLEVEGGQASGSQRSWRSRDCCGLLCRSFGRDPRSVGIDHPAFRESKKDLRQESSTCMECKEAL